MKYKKIILALLLLLTPLLSSQGVSAASNQFNRLSMQVDIEEDGSAQIEEVWDMNTYEGTEHYKVFNNMSGVTIKDFTVSDDSGTYKYVYNWNSSDSRENKKNTNGILVTSSGYELCFGVGEYGHNVYTLNYTIVNFVNIYADKQGMNWRLVSDGMDPAPTQVDIRISSYVPFTAENAEIYAFGFDGAINFVDGNIYATNQMSDGSYGRINYVNVLAGFDEELYGTGNTSYQHWTWSEVVSDAKEGSDYGSSSDDMTTILVFVVIIIVFSMGLAIGIGLLVRYRMKHYFNRKIKFTDGQNELPKKTEVDPFRDIPCNQDIFYFYYVVTTSSITTNSTETKSGLITAIILKWIRDGHIAFIKQEGSVFNKRKYEIDLNKEFAFDSPLEEQIFGFLKEAAGSTGILKAKSFERWCKRHYERMDSWFTRVETVVENRLIKENILHRKIEGKWATRVVDTYEPVFREEILHAAGLKNFLLEFSSIEQKTVNEVHLWENYLIFASILGVAEEVEQQLGKLFPEFNQMSYMDTTYTTLATRYFVYSGVQRSVAAKSASEIRSSGGGGASSFGGGGGGFSGGGGGGTR